MDSILATFSELHYSIYLKWLMLVVPAVMLALWHVSSKRYFEPLLEHPSAQTQKALFTLAKTRSLAIVFLWCMLSGTLIVYDFRYPAGMPEKAEEKPSAPTIAQVLAPPVTSQAQPEQEPYLDILKSKYEDAFLSFFYLKQCKAATDEDYQVLYASYNRQLERLGAPKTILDDTVTAAIGSFETVYSGSPCTPEAVAPMRSQFQRMLASQANATGGN